MSPSGQQRTGNLCGNLRGNLGREGARVGVVGGWVGLGRTGCLSPRGIERVACLPGGLSCSGPGRLSSTGRSGWVASGRNSHQGIRQATRRGRSGNMGIPGIGSLVLDVPHPNGAGWMSGIGANYGGPRPGHIDFRPQIRDPKRDCS